MSSPTRDQDRAADHHQQIYLRRLRSRQLSLSLLALGVCAGAVGAVVLAMALVPALQHARIAGLPVSLLMVIVPAFPLYIAVGHAYERRANALDRALSALVDEDEA